MSDISGLNELVRDFMTAPLNAQRKANQAVRDAARGVEAKWRQQAAFSRHAPLYPASITHDIEWKGAAVEAEIGPDKDLPQGALGNLIEYGSVNNPPHADGAAALQAQRISFEQALDKAVEP
jgi:hypothetical protein